MKPIPVSEFSGHVERLHADRDKLFEMEYEVSACSDYTARNYKLLMLSLDEVMDFLHVGNV